MKIREIILSCAGMLGAASTVQAADTIITPEPEAVEYVRVCDAYGAGYFYIPGTETCLRIHGYVRYETKAGDNVTSGEDRKGWDKGARFAFRLSTGSETELGTLKTYTELRFNYGSDNSGDDGVYGHNSSGVVMQFSYITLGGLKVGIDETEFKTFTGSLGKVITTGAVSADSGSTGKLSYTFTGDGFLGVLALEQGGKDYAIDGYVPHVVGGLKYVGGWGSIAGVVAYDSVIEGWSAKVRGDLDITDHFSAWLQGAYASEETPDQNYGRWGGDWAVWGGLSFKATKKAAFNLQIAHDDWGKSAVAANVAYDLVPGFAITPEINYTKFGGKWADTASEDDAWGGIIRFQRSF
ncbi:porin [Brucellaceae bacterium D45D]